MHKLSAITLTALLAIGTGNALVTQAGEPGTPAPDSSERKSVPTGGEQSKRHAKEEWKETTPPPPPRVKQGVAVPPAPPPAAVPLPSAAGR